MHMQDMLSMFRTPLNRPAEELIGKKRLSEWGGVHDKRVNDRAFG